MTEGLTPEQVAAAVWAEARRNFESCMDCSCPSEDMLAEALRAERARAEATVERLRIALRALVERLALVHASDAYKAVWTCNQIRFGPYCGPDYTEAFSAAKTALKTPEGDTAAKAGP